MLGYYKVLFGNWLFKVSSKKNFFVESGFNRFVFKMLYFDMCVFYDFLVDCENKIFWVIDEVLMILNVVEKMIMFVFCNMLFENDWLRLLVFLLIFYDILKLFMFISIMVNYYKLLEKE